MNKEAINKSSFSSDIKGYCEKIELKNVSHKPMNKYYRYRYLTKTEPKNLQREIPRMEKLDGETLRE